MVKLDYTHAGRFSFKESYSLFVPYCGIVSTIVPPNSQNGEQVNWLFVDMNSYFASVEQQVQPQLRGKPTAVVAVDTDSTVCIAASYEAKACGVSTGTLLGEARKKCPSLQVVVARHELYIDYHNRIQEAVESCLHVSKVVSIDEMECRLMGRERLPMNARALAQRIKQAIRVAAGETLRCSIGLAPNRFLAKTASNMQKPDGMVTITQSQLPGILDSLKPRDLPGIGSRMERRLHEKGIGTMKQLWRLDVAEMTQLWGGVVGTRFWLKLRGNDFDEHESHRSSIGHQHVLPPALRSREQACAVGKKLIHKAAVRLRRARLASGGMNIFVAFTGNPKPGQPGQARGYGRPTWEAALRFPSCQDTVTLVNAFSASWKDCPQGRPCMVGIVLLDLVPENMQNQSLFEEDGKQKATRLAHAMDAINEKYGSTTLYLGGIHRVRDSAPPRIAFSSIPDMRLK